MRLFIAAIAAEPIRTNENKRNTPDIRRSIKHKSLVVYCD
jgi:hypothetical protein